MKSLLFGVQRGGWGAELLLPAESMLEQLAFAIIEAVGFDMDHAYGFYGNLKNPYRSEEEYTLFADMGEEAKPGDRGVVSTPLDAVFKPGRKMLFLFDYGDEWLFSVACAGERNARAFKLPKLLAITGDPPLQYAD